MTRKAPPTTARTPRFSGWSSVQDAVRARNVGVGDRILVACSGASSRVTDAWVGVVIDVEWRSMDSVSLAREALVLRSSARASRLDVDLQGNPAGTGPALFPIGSSAPDAEEILVTFRPRSQHPHPAPRTDRLT